MPKLNLSKMTVSALFALRDEIQTTLAGRIERERADLQKQIDALAMFDARPGRLNGRAKRTAKVGPRGQGAPAQSRRTKTRKVAPKYRGPGGETWTGRGNAPRWLAALEAEGKKRESFLIKK